MKITSKKTRLVLDVKTKSGTFKTVFKWYKSDKAYVVTVPSLNGIATFGKTLTEAKRMAKEAIELFCEDVVEKGNIIIDDKKMAVGHIPNSRVIIMR